MKIRILLLLSILFAVSCQREDILSENGDKNHYGQSAGVIDGWVRIKLVDTGSDATLCMGTKGVIESPDEQIVRVAQALGATEIKRTFNEGGRFAERRRAAGLHLWYDLKIEESIPVTKAIGDFGALSSIAVAEGIPIVKQAEYKVVDNTLNMVLERASASTKNGVEMPFNDPFLPEQWHYRNDGSMPESKKGSDVNLFEAWKHTAGHPDVIVAVLDGGVDPEHEDLIDNLWVNEGELGGDEDNNGYVGDVHGWNFVKESKNIEPDVHGTHVAGTVSAVNNNGIGLCGVAGGTGKGDGVRIMICQTGALTAYEGIMPQSLGDAFAYAADNGALVAQCSWTIEGRYEAVIEGMEYFMEYAGTDPDTGEQTGPMKGGMIITASGNNGGSLLTGLPITVEGVVAVSAIDDTFEKAPYSNYGTRINISAPGGNTSATTAKGVYSTVTNNRYGWLEGTSMACPHVSGVVALMISKYGVGQQGFTVEDAKARLFRSYKNIYEDYGGPDANYLYIDKLGVGLVDALMILSDDGGKAPDPVEDIRLSWSSNAVGLAITAPKDQNGNPVYRYRVFHGSAPFTVDNINNIPQNVSDTTLFNFDSVGTEVDFSVLRNSNAGDYYLGIATVDMFGNVSDVEYFNNTSGNAPTVKNEIETIILPTTGEQNAVTIDLDNYFAAPSRITYSVAGNTNSTRIVASLSGSTLTLYAVEHGTSKITVSAADNSGTSVSQSFYVIAKDNSVALSLFPNQVKDNLYVLTGAQNEGKAKVIIYNNTGHKVLSYETNVTKDKALELDLRKLATGHYNFTIEVGGRKEKATFSKI